MAAPKMIRVPLRFYEDHMERDLPTPVNHSTSKSYALVDDSDPYLPELLNDAEFYCGTMKDEFNLSVPGIVKSARATVKAIREQAPHVESRAVEWEVIQ